MKDGIAGEARARRWAVLNLVRQLAPAVYDQHLAGLGRDGRITRNVGRITLGIGVLLVAGLALILVLAAAGRAPGAGPRQDRGTVPGLALPPVLHRQHRADRRADITHRRHAIIETVFADLIDGPLAHLPSGRFAANGGARPARPSPTTCCVPPAP